MSGEVIVVQKQHKLKNANFHTGKLTCGNKEINWIYDCGNIKSAQEYLKTVDTIDLIFISHFDVDHIRGIPTLLKSKKCQFAKVIVPYLTQEDLGIFVSVSCSNMDEMINFLQEVVMNISSDSLEKLDIDLNDTTHHEKYEIISIQRNCDIHIIKDQKIWLFKTHVVYEEILKNKLKKNKSNFVNKFKIVYKNAIKNVFRSTKEYRNIMTMSLYSAPASKQNNERTAWLHTGDAYLCDDKIFKEFAEAYHEIRNNVKYCVLPHHGSTESENKILYSYLPDDCHYIITPRTSVKRGYPYNKKIYCVKEHNFTTVWKNNLLIDFLPCNLFCYKKETLQEYCPF